MTQDKPMRCGAKTRSGGPCQSWPVTGKRRCRMHGGAPGSGAPSGSRNGMYQHGYYTKEAIAERRALSALVGALRPGTWRDLSEDWC